MLERAADLLERADDKNVIEFEKKVLDIVGAGPLATTSTTSLLSG